MKMYNSATLEKVIKVAAGEAYQNEVVETLMEAEDIGEGKEYASKEDWIETRIERWAEEARKK